MEVSLHLVLIAGTQILIIPHIEELCCWKSVITVLFPFSFRAACFLQNVRKNQTTDYNVGQKLKTLTQQKTIPCKSIFQGE